MLRKSLIVLCLCWTANTFAQENKNTEKQDTSGIDYKQIGAPMPALLLVACDNAMPQKKEKETANIAHKQFMTNDDFKNDANLFVMMFNPTCSHCEDETKLIENNIDFFKGSHIILLAAKIMKPYLPDFARSFHIADYPSIYLGSDSSNFISSVFLFTALPQINIYDSNRKLIKTYSGETAIDSLKKYARSAGESATEAPSKNRK